MTVPMRWRDASAAASAARAVFVRLQNLGEADAAARAELLAAGVGSAQVDTLYPTGFCALVPAICQQLTQPVSEQKLDLVGMGTTIANFINYLPKPEQYSISGDAGDFYKSPEFKQLTIAVRACRTAADPKVQIVNIEMSPMAMAYLYFLMKRRNLIVDKGRGQRLDETFHQLYTYLMPALAEEVHA